MGSRSSPTVGLVLSGGGVRGVAHIGVIQALREHGVEVSHFAGASAGALVGLMAAAQCSIVDMVDFFTETNPFRARNVTFDMSGLFDPVKFVDRMRSIVEFDTFEALPRRLTVAVTAMVEGKAKYISRGPLWPMVLASAAYPMVFSPVRQDGEVYMDGGITDNFPARAIRDECDVLLGVNVSPQRILEPDDLGDVSSILERVMDLQFGVRLDAEEEHVDLMINPDYLDTFSTFATSEAIDLFELGIEAGRAALPAIDELLGG